MKVPPTALESGKPLSLGKLIGRGGEGEVYLDAKDPSRAIKLYTTADRQSRLAKVHAMVQSGLAKRTPLAAFPLTIIEAPDRTFLGFAMRLVDGYRPLHELYAPGSRKHHFPHADYRFLARSATNIARAFESVHSVGCVIGDINHSGILISDKAIAALIDADSFQFSDGSTNHLCRVGVPEYTPPELQGRSLLGVVRTRDHDAFGLAVVLFQVLLMGRHPFIGTVRRGELPRYEDSIAQFRYVYTDSRDVGMDQPPGTPSLIDFAPELASLFDTAFSKGGVGSRPLPATWIQALTRFEATLVRCPDNALHYGPKGASECAWCEMEKRVGTALFLPHNPLPEPTRNVADPGRHRFNLDLLFQKIALVRIPSPALLRPLLPTGALQPSAAAVSAKSPKPKRGSSIGVGLMVGAAILFIAFPPAWFVSLILGWWGYSIQQGDPAPGINVDPFKRELEAARQAMRAECGKWLQRSGYERLARLKQDLEAARSDFQKAEMEGIQLKHGLRERKKETQLRKFLERFEIEKAKLQGVGPSRLAALSSYGVDTAADISAGKLMSVPGIGPDVTQRLMRWRHTIELDFVFAAADSDVDRLELARIDGLIESKSAPLRQKMIAGAIDLDKLGKAFEESYKRPDQILVLAHRRIEQARCDLEFLGAPQPGIDLGSFFAPNSPGGASPQSAPAQTSPQPRQGGAATRGSPASTSTASGASAPSCPRCSSSMVKRLARRGRNAGSYFWGCSRYPSCKGTRSI